MVPSQVSELLEHVTWALPEGGREGWNKRRIGSEAWFTIQRQQLHCVAFFCNHARYCERVAVNASGARK